MFLKKHIFFLIICLSVLTVLSGCKDKETGTESSSAASSSDITHGSVSSDDTVTSVPEDNKPVNNSQASSSDSSKPPKKPSSSSTASHLHAFLITRIAPTCTEDGYTLYKCNCGETKMDSYISKKGHSWSDWKTVTVATVLSAGAKERTCTVCSVKEMEALEMLSPDYSAMQKELSELVNSERVKNGLSELEYSAQKQGEADSRVKELADNFAVKQGEDFSELIYNSGLNQDGNLTAQAVFDYWMNNEETKKIILSEDYTSAVVGVTLQDGKYYWVQIFL